MLAWLPLCVAITLPVLGATRGIPKRMRTVAGPSKDFAVERKLRCIPCVNMQ